MPGTQWITSDVRAGSFCRHCYPWLLFLRVLCKFFSSFASVLALPWLSLLSPCVCSSWGISWWSSCLIHHPFNTDDLQMCFFQLEMVSDLQSHTQSCLLDICTWMSLVHFKLTSSTSPSSPSSYLHLLVGGTITHPVTKFPLVAR